MSSTASPTCRRASWSRNMSTSPTPSSTATRPAWSMPCSISLPASCARASSKRRGDVMAKRRKPQESGEDRLISRYFKPLARHPGALGLTDDAAVLGAPAGHQLVLTADAIVGGVHFFVDDPPGTVAQKALRVNLSDLAAKGARPVGFLLTLALPKTLGQAWLAAFTKGLGADA